MIRSARGFPARLDALGSTAPWGIGEPEGFVISPVGCFGRLDSVRWNVSQPCDSASHSVSTSTSTSMPKDNGRLAEGGGRNARSAAVSKSTRWLNKGSRRVGCMKLEGVVELGWVIVATVGAACRSSSAGQAWNLDDPCGMSGAGGRHGMGDHSKGMESHVGRHNADPGRLVPFVGFSALLLRIPMLLDPDMPNLHLTAGTFMNLAVVEA